MSDSEELKRLRADLESVNGIRVRYQSDIRLEEIRNDLFDKIARLEAEADPWREAKKDLAYIVKALDWKSVGYYVDHLTAENDRLAKRVAELEAEIKAEDGADIADAEKALAEMVRANQDMGFRSCNRIGGPRSVEMTRTSSTKISIQRNHRAITTRTHTSREAHQVSIDKTGPAS